MLFFRVAECTGRRAQLHCSLQRADDHVLLSGGRDSGYEPTFTDVALVHPCSLQQGPAVSAARYAAFVAGSFEQQGAKEHACACCFVAVGHLRAFHISYFMWSINTNTHATLFQPCSFEAGRSSVSSTACAFCCGQLLTAARKRAHLCLLFCGSRTSEGSSCLLFHGEY